MLTLQDGCISKTVSMKNLMSEEDFLNANNLYFLSSPLPSSPCHEHKYFYFGIGFPLGRFIFFNHIIRAHLKLQYGTTSGKNTTQNCDLVLTPVFYSTVI